MRTRIGQTQRIAISTASIYELVQLVERGRLTLAIELLVWLRAATLEANIEVIAIDGEVKQTAAELPPVHGDPLDRFIIATAITSALSLVSLDRKFAGYPNLSELLIAL